MNVRCSCTMRLAASWHAPFRPAALPRLRRRLRRDGHLRQAGVPRRDHRRHPARLPVRDRSRRLLARAARGGTARRGAHARPPRPRPGAGARRRRLRRAGRLLLRGAAADGRVPARDAALHLPDDRDGGGGRDRPRARQSPHGDRAGARLDRPRPVLANGAGTHLDPLGTALGLTAAAIYSVYILSAQPISSRVAPFTLMTLVCTGAAASLSVAALVVSDLDPGAVTVAGAGWLLALGIVSTVAAVGLFFAGLSRVGPSTAAMLSTLEPVVTIGLAFLVFGEEPGRAALVGGLLVLAAVPALQVRVRRPSALAAEA